jgi:hypothetical protein
MCTPQTLNSIVSQAETENRARSQRDWSWFRGMLIHTVDGVAAARTEKLPAGEVPTRLTFEGIPFRYRSDERRSPPCGGDFTWRIRGAEQDRCLGGPWAARRRILVTATLSVEKGDPRCYLRGRCSMRLALLASFPSSPRSGSAARVDRPRDRPVWMPRLAIRFPKASRRPTLAMGRHPQPQTPAMDLCARPTLGMLRSARMPGTRLLRPQMPP